MNIGPVPVSVDLTARHQPRSALLDGARGGTYLPGLQSILANVVIPTKPLPRQSEEVHEPGEDENDAKVREEDTKAGDELLTAEDGRAEGG